MSDSSSFYAAAHSRRSIRAFLPDPVPDDVLTRCLDAALLAPTSSNLQLLRFVVLRSDAAKAEGAKVCLQQDPAVTAPLLVALVAQPGRWREHRTKLVELIEAKGPASAGFLNYYRRLIPLVYLTGPLNLLAWWKPAFCRIVSLFRPVPRLLTQSGVRITAHKSAALAAAAFMLALRAEGYDSCPMEGFDPYRSRALLSLAPGEEVCMYFAVGKRDPAKPPRDRVLLPREWMVSSV